MAVLGILAVNIAGFAGPMAATFTPAVPGPASAADNAVFAAVMLLFEGKMRALFSLLFGASMMLFIERADAAERDGQTLQLRRLGWLALFGWLHYVLLWWGDILFLYACAGILALALRQMPRRGMLTAALMAFTLWQAHGIVEWLPAAVDEQAVAHAAATAQQRRDHAENADNAATKAQREMAVMRLPYPQLVRTRLTDDPLFPIETALTSLGETLPYMLIGMLLFGSGFFWGQWSRGTLVAMAVGGIGLGGAASLAAVWWSWSHAFPLMAMIVLIGYALAVPHLLMALGYAATLMLAGPRLATSAIGLRLIAAGRMAFTNYFATSLVMTGLFYGWGLGLAGHVPVAMLPLFVLLGWALMLGWSKPWLARFRRGPLEWLWRSLTEGRRLPFLHARPC